MTAKVDLGTLMDFIGDAWPFDEKNYPGFDALPPEGQLAFTAKHSVLHMNKSLAKIAAECEKADHGQATDERQLRTATAKMLVNTLKLAYELNMQPGELARLAEGIVNGKL